MPVTSGLGWPVCVCNIGAQQCGIHPRPRMTKEDHIAFRKAWDKRVEEGQRASKET